MFTWVCPNCGGSVDVAADTCPHCSTPNSDLQDEVEDLASEAAEDLEPEAPLAAAAEEGVRPDLETEGPRVRREGAAARARPVGLPVLTDSYPRARREGAAAREPSPSLAPDAPEGPPISGPGVEERESVPADSSSPGLAVTPRQLILFGVGLVVAVLAAVWLAGGGGLPGLRLEDPPEAVEAPVEAFAIGVSGPIEVSAIRPYYDEAFQTHVKAFVANHSREPQSVAFSVLLRVREGGGQAPPMATFEVVLPEPIPPNGGQEVDLPLAALGSLQAMPPWDQLRVDLEPL